jgi:hypothetical protein
MVPLKKIEQHVQYHDHSREDMSGPFRILWTANQPRHPRHEFKRTDIIASQLIFLRDYKRPRYLYHRLVHLCFVFLHLDYRPSRYKTTAFPEHEHVAIDSTPLLSQHHIPQHHLQLHTAYFLHRDAGDIYIHPEAWPPSSLDPRPDHREILFLAPLPHRPPR